VPLENSYHFPRKNALTKCWTIFAPTKLRLPSSTFSHEKNDFTKYDFLFKSPLLILFANKSDPFSNPFIILCYSKRVVKKKTFSSSTQISNSNGVGFIRRNIPSLALGSYHFLYSLSLAVRKENIKLPKQQK